MAVNYQILGDPGRDNALYVEVDTGQQIIRLLFDCGEACLRDLSVSRIQAIDAVFFSHFHVDHVAGFDTFFRYNYCRPGGPVRIFGPLRSTEIMHHRFRGFTWNLVEGAEGEFQVTDVGPDSLATTSFMTSEGFANPHPGDVAGFDGCLLQTPVYRVEARILDHGTPSLGYCVRELPRKNVDVGRLAELGLSPGPWLKDVKDDSIGDDRSIEIAGRQLLIGDLRSQLLLATPGESIAYLTDFSLDAPAADRLVDWLRGTTVLVCENNYRNQDKQLADRNYHMVSDDVARLAAAVGPERLILFHLSDRYQIAEWSEQLNEVREIFPDTYFPEQWGIPHDG